MALGHGLQLHQHAAPVDDSPAGWGEQYQHRPGQQQQQTATPPAPVNGGLMTGEPGRWPWGAVPVPRESHRRVWAMNPVVPDAIPGIRQGRSFVSPAEAYPDHVLVDGHLLVRPGQVSGR